MYTCHLTMTVYNVHSKKDEKTIQKWLVVKPEQKLWESMTC